MILFASWVLLVLAVFICAACGFFAIMPWLSIVGFLIWMLINLIASNSEEYVELD